MKSILSVCLSLQLAFTAALAGDPMTLSLRSTNTKSKKRYNIADKKLAKKIKLQARHQKSKKKDKYKDVNALFANVDYKTTPKKEFGDDEFFKELADVSDIENSDKLERKFVKKQNKQLIARKKKKVYESITLEQMLAEQDKKDAQKLERQQQQQIAAEQKHARPQQKKQIQERHKEILVADNSPTSYAAITQSPTESTSTADLEDNIPSGPSSWSITPFGGYGLFSIEGTQSNALNRSTQNFENMGGYVGGILVDWGAGRWQIESGLAYMRASTKRQVLDRTLLGMNDDYVEYIDRDYVVIPMMGVFHFTNRNSGNSLYAKAGVWGAYLTSATSERLSSTSMFDSSFDSSNQFQRMDFLGSVGAGGRIKIGQSMGLVIEGYYLRGFNNVSGSNVGYVSGNNQAFLGSLGLTFDL